MRRELEILTRAWASPIPALCAGGLVLAAFGVRNSSLTPYLSGSSYVVALMGAALALHAASRVERAAWSRPARRQDLLLLLGSAASAWLLTCTVQLALGTLPNSAFGIGSLVGCGHLAALTLVARRMPLGPNSRTLAFLAAATVLPALAPILRPLLDASLLFHAGHFPRWGAALAPILSLVVIAIALPARAQPVLVGEPTA